MTDLPAGWQLRQIGDLLAPLANGRLIEQGWSPQCEKEPSPQASIWGVLKTTAIQAGRFEPEHNKRLPDHLAPRPAIEVHAGDLLLTSAGPRARCAVPCLVRDVRARLMLSGKMYRFRADPRIVDSRYLEALLLSPDVQDELDRLKTGISDSGLNLTQARFLEMLVPVAPLGQQRCIVDRLDDHLSRLEAAHAYLTVAATRLSTLKAASLSGALEAHAHQRAKLADLLRQPISNGRSVTSRAGGFPVLRLTAIKQDGIDLAESKEGAWTASEAFPYLVEDGDFLVARGNGTLRLVGRGALVGRVGQPVAYPDTMMRIRVDENRVHPGFLSMIWQSAAVRDQIESQARTTAGIYKVNQKHLGAIEVPLPRLEDQLQLVKSVRDAYDSADRLAAVVARQLARETALRRALLDVAFSGRLTGRSSDVERAEALIGAAT